MRLLLCAALALALTSCASARSRRTHYATDAVQPVQMGYAQVGEGSERGVLPSEIDPGVLRDEARLLSYQDQTCMELHMRTPRGFDEPLEMRELNCWFDGDELPAQVRAQSEPRQQDYPFTGDPPALEIAGHHGWFSIALGPGQPRVFHVVERDVTLCCPGRGQTEAEVVVKSRWRGGGPFYKLGFKWELAPVAAPSAPPAATP